MKNLMLVALVLASQASPAQKVVSVKSKTTFFSSAVLENITATTTKGKSVINLLNGEIAFSIPINSFEFFKSLMQEHFNEKYMETEKFPKATFLGRIDNWDNKKDLPEAVATGNLIIHGVSKQFSAKGSVVFKGDMLIIEAKFNVHLKDFEVEVPSIMFQKIAKDVEITVTYEYAVYEN
ncbi:MAG: YceI family protein [Cyclobacteriaceae bacterium]|nr:YceI family protein [Cyclobacteriaceae bacterium]